MKFGILALALVGLMTVNASAGLFNRGGGQMMNCNVAQVAGPVVASPENLVEKTAPTIVKSMPIERTEVSVQLVGNRCKGRKCGRSGVCMQSLASLKSTQQAEVRLALASR